MPAKLFLTDWRGPESWTSGHRSRAGAMVSCSLAWGKPAFAQKPIAGMTTLVGTAMNMQYFQGIPSGAPGEPWYQIATEATALGYDLWPLVDTQGATQQARLRNFYDENGIQTFLLNILIPGAGRWLAQRLVDFTSWADGFHFDYWTAPDLWVQYTPGFVSIAGNEGPAFAVNKAYMRAMNRVAHQIRSLRALQGKSTVIIGQQYHNMNGTTEIREIGGRYIEQDPKRWSDDAGVTPWQSYHQPRIDSFSSIHGSSPKRENMVFEFAVRGGAGHNAPPTSPSYQSEMMAFANTNNCFVSWGRDALAGVGWPG